MILKQIKIWLQKNCVQCGKPKPKFTAFCDDCWKQSEGLW